MGVGLVHYTADDGTLRTIRQAFTSAAAVDPFARVPANAGSVTIPVTINDDSVDDDGETIVVRLLRSGDYRAATPDSVTLTIRNHDPVPEPEVSIAAGAGVTEGGSASFTLTADPAPTAPLEVSVTIAAEGEFGIAAGERTVTIPVTGSYELTLETAGDGVDEPDGSVTATVDAGNGYTVGAASSGTVAIADDDALSAAHPLVKHAPVVKRFFDRITARNQHGNGAAGGWNKRFLKAMGHPDYVNYPQAAVTVADATRIWNHGGPGANTAWNGTVAAVTYAERYFAGQVTLHSSSQSKKQLIVPQQPFTVSSDQQRDRFSWQRLQALMDRYWPKPWIRHP